MSGSRVAFGLLPIALVALWIVAVGATPPIDTPVRFVVAYLLAFAVYGIAAALALRPGSPRFGLSTVVAVGIVLRIVSIPGAPSDDVNRYLWEGELQRRGVNPYVHAPEAPELRSIAESFPGHDGINHPDWSAIYPPVAQSWMRLFAHDALTLKLSLLLAELAALAFLILLLDRHGLPRGRSLIYWWNPLPLLSFAVEAHNDVIGIALFLAAIWALDTGRSLAGGTLGGLAIMAKGFALAAVPAYARRLTAGSALLAGVTALAVSAPFFTNELDLTRSLLRFGGELSYNDSLHALIESTLGSAGFPEAHHSRLVAAFIWVLVALVVAIRVRRGTGGRREELRAAAMLIAAMLMLLPTVHPWYLSLLVPLLCFFPWLGWLALTGTAVLPHLAQIEIARTGDWVEWHWIKWLEYAPLYGWLAWCAARRMTRSGSARSRHELVGSHEES